MVYPRKVQLEEENTNKIISDDKRKKKRKGIKSEFPDGVVILMGPSLAYDTGATAKARRRPVEEKESLNKWHIRGGFDPIKRVKSPINIEIDA